MLKIKPKDTFKAKVGLSVPGSEKLEVISVEYRHLSRSALQEYYAGLKGKTDAEGLAEIMRGWDGPDAAYSPESLQELLDNYPASAGELYESFRAELVESKRKN
ncbi:phage tail assembly chaperone [Azonexus sp.]|uniref:phage tail assembly chaperone n=1 Tax=Azonexus sp. TaxID=1872668 RepID=UPI0027BA6CE7|nr:phage tail assembly chaperone [Azonexus sp.]